MLGKLALLLKGKVAAAILGTLLLAGGGATAVLAANGAQVQLPLVSQAQEHPNDDANDDRGNDQGASHDDGQDEQQAEGTIKSLDADNSSFVLQLSNGTTKTVTVSARTIFDGGLSTFADLKAGLFVEVRGNLQANGTLAATRVHGEDDDANDDHGGANEPGDDHGGNSGSGGSGDSGSGGNSGSGRGGHDDGSGHN